MSYEGQGRACAKRVSRFVGVGLCGRYAASQHALGNQPANLDLPLRNLWGGPCAQEPDHFLENGALDGPADRSLQPMLFLASAIERMKLYVEAYGLTEQRVFTTGFMVWLTLAFVWLAVTVLQNKKDRFAFGALFAGFAVIFGLNYINPDGMIARIDMRVPNRVDVDTLASLSLDAAPAISSRIGTLPSEQQRELKAQLQKNWQDQAGSSDWRSVTLSRLRYQATGHDWLKP